MKRNEGGNKAKVIGEGKCKKKTHTWLDFTVYKPRVSLLPFRIHNSWLLCFPFIHSSFTGLCLE